MAFTYQIQSQSISGNQVTFMGQFTDGGTFQVPYSFSFSTDGSVSLAAAHAQVITVGTAIKAQQVLAQQLQSLVGTSITIP